MYLRYEKPKKNNMKKNILILAIIFLLKNCDSPKKKENYSIVDNPIISKIDSIQIMEKTINMKLLGRCYKGDMFFDESKIKMIPSKKIQNEVYYQFINRDSSNTFLKEEYTSFDFLMKNQKHTISVLDKESVQDFCSETHFPINVDCDVYLFKLYRDDDVQYYMLIKTMRYEDCKNKK